MQALRRLIAAAASMLPLAIVTPLLADEPAPPPPHIRPLSADARELVTSGVTRSELIRELIAHLETSAVVVYIDYGWLGAERSGPLAFLSVAGGRRYGVFQNA